MNSVETNLALSVSGYVQDRPTQMLVDTGSAVTIEEANNGIEQPLQACTDHIVDNITHTR